MIDSSTGAAPALRQFVVLEGEFPNETDAKIVRYAISREEWKGFTQTDSSKQAPSAHSSPPPRQVQLS